MIHCENLVKIYQVLDQEVFALQGLDLHVESGEMMAIIGNSGSGKSTLMNILGGLDRPTAGKVTVAGQDLLRCSDKELMRYKRNTVGFVWQNNAQNLLPYLTALQNVQMPMLLGGKLKRKVAEELLERVGLTARMHQKLSELSGGEQQRVAIAIALANQPNLLLADEPTGNVDTSNADLILDIFRRLNADLGLTVVIVTHDLSLAKKVDRIVNIRDGRTSSEILRVMPRTAKREVDNGIDGLVGDESQIEGASELLAEAEGLQSATELEYEPEEEETHIEYAVLDGVGRIQIPADYLKQIALNGGNKLRVSLNEGQIVLTPPEE